MPTYQSQCQILQSSPKRWLVTGAAGFIGSSLVEKLLSLGQTVVGLDNFSTGFQYNLDHIQAAVSVSHWENFRFIHGDVRDPSTCSKATTDIDIVLHQAALGSVPRSLQLPDATHQSNVDGFFHMLLAASKNDVSKFVYASSSSVYGDNATLPKVENKTGNALSPYAASKQINELYAAVFRRCYDLPTVGLRYFNIFGPRQDPNGSYAAVIPKWIQSLLQGEPCTVFGDGTNSRDFCYIDNAVQANILAATTDISAMPNEEEHIFNVGLGEQTNLKVLFQLIKESVATHHTQAITSELQFGPDRTGDIPHSLADITKTKQHLDFVPSIRIGEGIKATVNWYAKNRA